MRLFTNRRRKETLIEPDEVFIDSGNLPEFDTQQFEGVIERPIRTNVIFLLGVAFFVVMFVFLGKIFSLQIIEGGELSERSERNSLSQEVLFAERGVIYDRNQTLLAWNNPEREYGDYEGLGHILGYVAFPTEGEIEGSGFHPKEFVGRDGTEKLFNNDLRGENGLKVVEVNVAGEVTSESVQGYAQDGDNITLSIDAELQDALYGYIRNLALDKGYLGGSGVVMDVETGELLALTNYPEYDSEVLSLGEDRDTIAQYSQNEGKPFLNRAVSGLYTPGSIFKPFVAIAALNEGIISPEKIIFTDGKLSLPHPYIPDTFSIFRDWKNHGPVNMEEAIAYSSNVYFFQIGGGFESQQGLGIDRIREYAQLFGFERATQTGLSGEDDGLIPDPDWKEETFDEVWRVGDTYNTSIGQYASQVTPLQVARAVAALANGGNVVNPSLQKREKGEVIHTIDIDQRHFEEVQKGMRAAVTYGTASGLNIPNVSVAAKTGTAEIDFGKRFVNSWVTGFFPYENPRYTFAVVMEKGPRDNFIGGVFVARQLLEWMSVNTPEYFEEEESIDF